MSKIIELTQRAETAESRLALAEASHRIKASAIARDRDETKYSLRTVEELLECASDALEATSDKLAVAMAELELLKFELAASQRHEIALERKVAMLERAAGL